MHQVTEHVWRKAGYPLQASFPGSTYPSSSPPSWEEVDKSSTAQRTDNVQNTGGPPWYRIVTNKESEQPLREPLRRNGSDFLSQQCPHDLRAAYDSSIEASLSQMSNPAEALHDNQQSQQRSIEDESTAADLVHGKNEISIGPSQQTHDCNSVRAPTETATEHDRDTPPPLERKDHDGARAAPLDQSQATKRILRRTPRSRRLKDIASEQSMESLLSPESSTSTAGSEDVLPSAELVETVKSNKPRRRQAYPLQAPASIANLRHSPTPPSSPEREKEVENTVTASQPQRSNQPAKKSKSLRRHAYPLQAPASITNLHDTFTPPPSPDRIAGDQSSLTTDHTSEKSNTATRGKKLRRPGYPLQAPASIVDLRRSTTHVPPLTVEGDLNSTSQMPMSSLREENKVRAESEQQLPHPTYPLQSSPSIPAILHSPPSPILEDNPDKQSSPAADRSREKELATKVVQHWQRQTYPIQSANNTSPFHRSPTPQPPWDEAAEKRKSEQIHLPKNIRAVKDTASNASPGRTIIICLDGTGDKFDNDNSNIVHLISALKKDDPHQVSYYQAGIGTYSAGGLSSGISAAMDMAVGSGLGLHVRDAYHFLMHSYKEGDKICIFGFSRGAYTARCLAGMIHKVGLLPPRNIQQIPFAYEFYANDTTDGWKQSQDFKATFCIDVCVYFLGCFDSVASVGFIPRQLPLSTTPTSKPRYFRHAMALDERRAKFKICRHVKKDWEERQRPNSPVEANAKLAELSLLHPLPNFKDHPKEPLGTSLHMQHQEHNHHHHHVTDEEYKDITAHEAPFDTDVLEVWFAGAHADVGGGAVPNDERHKLAQIPLRWMIRQAFECNTGIIFKTKMLVEFGLDVHTLWPKYERLNTPSYGPSPSFLEKYEKGLPPRSVRLSKLVPINKHEKGEQLYHLKSYNDEDWTPEQVEDFYDAMSPLNDQLVQAPSWWILEFWPVEYKIPKTPGEITTRTGMNLGRYRGVEDRQPNVHWTVLHRAQHIGYKIRARTAAHTTWQAVV